MYKNAALLCVCLLVLGWAAVPGTVQGAGFGLYEGSARTNAMGGNLAGSADDPSALFYNPAGITQLEGIQFMAGSTFIMPDTDVKTINPYNGQETTSNSRDHVWIPPHMYTTYQFSDHVWFGLGVFSRFGLGTNFDSNWAGRYNNYDAVIKTVSVNPNIAVKLNDKVSVAAGIEWMYFDLTLKNKIDPLKHNNPAVSTFDVDNNLKGDSTGLGFNLGIFYKPTNWLSCGLSYRSKIKQPVSGDADFTKPAGLPLPEYLFRDTAVNGSIDLPPEWMIGIAVRPTDRLLLQVGGIYTEWSTYKDLTMNFDTDPVPGTSSITVPKNWDDVWRLTFGAEYRALDWLDLRIGYIFDESPIPDSTIDYLVPANDRHMFTFGSGIHWRNMLFDISYTYLLIEDRDIKGRPQDGVFDGETDNGDAHLIGVSVSYRF